jgi:hypothetical protein
MIKSNYINVSEFAQYNSELDLSLYTAITISGMISRASAEMDNFLNYSLGVEEIVAEKSEAMVSNNGNLVIYTRKVPIISVSSIKLKLGTVSLNLNLTDGNGNPRYDIPARARSVTYPYQEISMTGVFSVRNFYQLRGVELFSQIDYRAGFETIPDDLKDACNLWAKDIFMRSTNPMDLRGISQGAITMYFRDKDDSGDGAYMRQAKNILQSYKKVT